MAYRFLVLSGPEGQKQNIFVKGNYYVYGLIKCLDIGLTHNVIDISFSFDRFTGALRGGRSFQWYLCNRP